MNDEGFDHIKGCELLESITMKKCSYITDEGLSKLIVRKDSLKYLEIDQCKNITDEGLKSLIALKNLKKLVLKDLPYVKDMNAMQSELKASLTDCEIVISN